LWWPSYRFISPGAFIELMSLRCLVAQGNATLVSKRVSVPVEILNNSIPVGGAFVLTSVMSGQIYPREVAVMPTILYYPQSAIEFEVTEEPTPQLNIAWTLIACQSGLRVAIYNFSLTATSMMDFDVLHMYSAEQSFVSARANLTRVELPARRFWITHFKVTGTTFGEDEQFCTHINETASVLEVQYMHYSSRARLDVRVQIVDWEAVESTSVDFFPSFVNSASFRTPDPNTLLISSTCVDSFTGTAAPFAEAGFFTFTTAVTNRSQLAAPVFAAMSRVGSILGNARRRAVVQHIKLAANAAEVSYVDISLAKTSFTGTSSLPFARTNAVFPVLLAPNGICAPTTSPDRSINPAMFVMVLLQPDIVTNTTVQVARRSSTDDIQCAVAVVRLLNPVPVTVATTPTTVNTFLTITSTSDTRSSGNVATTTTTIEGTTAGSSTGTQSTIDSLTTMFTSTLTVTTLGSLSGDSSSTSTSSTDALTLPLPPSGKTPALSTAALGGIIGGSVAGGLLVLALVLVCLFRGRKKTARQPTDDTATTTPPLDVYGDVSDVRNSYSTQMQMQSTNVYSDVSDIHQ
jgi:hypothetical protein